MQGERFISNTNFHGNLNANFSIFMPNGRTVKSGTAIQFSTRVYQRYLPFNAPLRTHFNLHLVSAPSSHFGTERNPLSWRINRSLTQFESLLWLWNLIFPSLRVNLMQSLRNSASVTWACRKLDQLNSKQLVQSVNFVQCFDRVPTSSHLHHHVNNTACFLSPIPWTFCVSH